MTGARFDTRDRRGAIAYALIALALMLRVLVPAGFMPVSGDGYAVTLCTGSGAVTAWIDDKGRIHEGDRDGGDARHQPCAFAGLAVPADLGAAPALPPSFFETAAAPLAMRLAAAAVGRGLAAPPPPPTGPPALT